MNHSQEVSMRSVPGLLIFVSALSLMTAGPASAAGKQRISTDPFTNADSQHATEVEPDTFAFGSTVVSTFQAGRFFDGGASGIGFVTSPDGGSSWVQGFLPSLTVNSIPAGPYARASDPAVAYDAMHDVWLISSLAVSSVGTGLAVLVSRSTDGGMSWGAPIIVASTTGFFDKEWVVCDNSPSSSHYGNCYVTWDDAVRSNLLLSSTSSNGGQTWGTEKATKDKARGIGGQPLVNPAGDVVVPTLSVFGDAILAYGSKNGGKSWTASTVVASVTQHVEAGSLRSEALPSAEIDAAGTAYVVWQDCRFRAGCSSNDIVMSTSSDGMTWTSPVRIPIDPTTSTVDHFIPGLAVDRSSSGDTARLALTYYFYPDANCDQDTCQLTVGFLSSVDGGATWTTPKTLAGPMALTDLANTDQGFMVGDYISTSFSGTDAISVYALGKTGFAGVLNEGMFASLQPVTAADAHPLRVVDDPVLSVQGDRLQRAQAILP
jgi:hypothetical protein